MSNTHVALVKNPAGVVLMRREGDWAQALADYATFINNGSNANMYGWTVEYGLINDEEPIATHTITDTTGEVTNP